MIGLDDYMLDEPDRFLDVEREPDEEQSDCEACGVPEVVDPHWHEDRRTMCTACSEQHRAPQLLEAAE